MLTTTAGVHLFYTNLEQVLNLVNLQHRGDLETINTWEKAIFPPSVRNGKSNSAADQEVLCGSLPVLCSSDFA